jgi:hypothetical protein
LIGGVVVIDAWRKHSLYRAVFSLLHRLLILDGTIRGFWLPSPLPSQYPARVDVLKRVDHLQKAYDE